jgi:hypothetical protein
VGVQLVDREVAESEPLIDRVAQRNVCCGFLGSNPMTANRSIAVASSGGAPNPSTTTRRLSPKVASSATRSTAIPAAGTTWSIRASATPTGKQATETESSGAMATPSEPITRSSSMTPMTPSTPSDERTMASTARYIARSGRTG